MKCGTFSDLNTKQTGFYCCWIKPDFPYPIITMLYLIIGVILYIEYPYPVIVVMLEFTN